MSTIPLLETISFTTEHTSYKVSNLVKGMGKWTIPVKNVVAVKGSEITKIEAEFKLPPCSIEAIDVGNCWTANLDIEVGRSGQSASQRLPLLANKTAILMTRLDCRTGANSETIKFFDKDDLNPEVTNSSKPFDRLLVTCSQPHRNDVLFGLSALHLRGKRHDVSASAREDLVLSGDTLKPVGVHSLMTKVEKQTVSSKRTERPPDWTCASLRASKLIEKSLTTTSGPGTHAKPAPPSSRFQFKKYMYEEKSTTNTDEKENTESNRDHFLSPLRKKLRQDDDLALDFEKSEIPKGSKNRNKFTFVDTAKRTKDEEKRGQKAVKKKAKSTKSKPDSAVAINLPSDYLKYDDKSLQRAGYLVQLRAYKKTKSLPMIDGTEISVQAGKEVRFIKRGANIVMVYKGQVHHPEVKPEHVAGLFKDYTNIQLMINRDFKSPRKNEDQGPQRPDSVQHCPLCSEEFSDQNKLIEHCATCNGNVEDVVEPRPGSSGLGREPKNLQDCCPICSEYYPVADLESHAQECAEQMFGGN